MVTVGEARETELDELVALESALFAEDAGQHDPHADPTWPSREGHQDFVDLLASDDGIVLAARVDGAPVGLLAGYAIASSPTRQPVRYAVLRTMYVAPEARRLGAATMLTERFLEWARGRGCVEAHVDHYAANTAAGRLYEGVGFAERSISRSLTL